MATAEVQTQQSSSFEGSVFGFTAVGYNDDFVETIHEQDLRNAVYEPTLAEFWSRYEPRSSGEDLLVAKYNFRPAARIDQPSFCAWLDQDTSGDFDPSGKVLQLAVDPPRKRSRILHEGDFSEASSVKKPKVSTWRLGRCTGSSFPIKFRLTSDAGRALLSSLGNSTDWWPASQRLDLAFEPNFSELNTESIQPQRLRSRANFTSSSLLYDPHSQYDLPYPSLSELTLGHPAARGCKNCAELGLVCGLLQEGEKYPCSACREDGNDCELVVPPVQKRPCESCRRRRIVCSYRVTDDHSGPCKDCANTDRMCIAGPLSGRTRTGPSLDQDPSSLSKLLVAPERKYRKCTQRSNAKICSATVSKPGSDFCTRGKEKGVGCELEVIETDRKRSSKNNEEKDLVSQQPLCHASKPIRASTTKIIKTRLPHPIVFNYLEPEDGSAPCNWCEDLIHGILGLGPIEVEIMDNHDGQGYTEIKGGHVSRGAKPSKMCPQCTLTRLKIAVCGEHQLTMLDGERIESERVFDFLLPGMASQAPFDWCSVCPSAAVYSCTRSTDLEVLTASHDEDNEGISSCGLRLCECCAAKLVSEYSGSLTTMITDLEDEVGMDAFSLRADANFLRSDGHLFSRIYD